MLNEQDRERIRQGYYVEKKSIHLLAREEGCNRITIRKALANDSQPFKPIARQRPSPVFGPYKERVERLLEENARLPRKQRYTAHRIYEILREEGFQGSESTVRLHVSRHKQATRGLDVFLPLEYDPGQDAQVDWGEAYAVIGGCERLSNCSSCGCVFHAERLRWPFRRNDRNASSTAM